MNRRKGLGEVEVLMAVMMMECHTEQVVITVMMATVVGGGGGDGGNVCFWILQIGSSHKALTCWNFKDIPRTFHVSILPDCLSGNEGLNPYTSPHLLDSY